MGSVLLENNLPTTGCLISFPQCIGTRELEPILQLWFFNASTVKIYNATMIYVLWALWDLLWIQNYVGSPIFLATFCTVKIMYYFWQRRDGHGLHIGWFFNKLIWSPWSWGRCYDHNFLQLLTIFGEKIGVFLKNQCYDQNFA
jgi:hypothetical protein